MLPVLMEIIKIVILQILMIIIMIMMSLTVMTTSALFSRCIFLAGIPDEQPASPSRPPSTPAVAVLVGVAGPTTVGVTRLDRWAGPALPRNR
jgi:hypothetical protein